MGETTTAPEPSSDALGQAIEIAGQGVNVHDGTNSPDSVDLQEPGGSSSNPLGSAGSKMMRGHDEQTAEFIYPKLDGDSKVTGDMVYDVAGDAKKIFSTSNSENDPSSPPAKLVSPVRLLPPAMRAPLPPHLALSRICARVRCCQHSLHASLPPHPLNFPHDTSAGRVDDPGATRRGRLGRHSGKLRVRDVGQLPGPSLLRGADHCAHHLREHVHFRHVRSSRPEVHTGGNLWSDDGLRTDSLRLVAPVRQRLALQRRVSHPSPTDHPPPLHFTLERKQRFAEKGTSPPHSIFEKTEDAPSEIAGLSRSLICDRIDGNSYSGAQDKVEAYQNELVGIKAADSVSERTKTHSSFNILFIHQNKDGADKSIFTPKKVQEMCNIEKVVTEHALWKYFCPLDSNTGACAHQPYSAVNRFYLTEAERKECALLDQAVVDQRATALMTGLLTSANGFFANEGAQEGKVNP